MAEKKVAKELPSHTIVIYQSPLGPDEIFHNSHVHGVLIENNR